MSFGAGRERENEGRNGMGAGMRRKVGTGPPIG